MKTNWIEFLKELHEYHDRCCATADYRSSNKAFISEDVFGLITYDDDLAEKLCDEVLEVLQVLIRKENFEYIEESEEKYFNFIRCCNYAFLSNIIDWGTSIRGCFIKDYEAMRVCGETIPPGEVLNFLKSVIEYSKHNN